MSVRLASSVSKMGLTRVSIVKKNVRFAGDMGIKKNKHVEQWNGLREITENTFEYDAKTVPMLVTTIVVIPFFLYNLFKADLQTSKITCIQGKPKYM